MGAPKSALTDNIHLRAVTDDLRGDGCRYRDRELELIIRGIQVAAGCENHGQLRTPGFFELTHHQLADPGRGAPVHIAPVVAGYVGAQGMERDVVVGDLLRNLALQVAHQTGRGWHQAYGFRMHEQVDCFGPLQCPPQQSQLVAAHRLCRAGDDDRAFVGWHGKEFFVLILGFHRRELKLGDALADGEFHPGRWQ